MSIWIQTAGEHFQSAMPIKDRENLKIIRFNTELLPIWAQLLDVAARLCRARDETQRWFARFANSNGVDDSRTVLAHCWALRHDVEDQKDLIMAELRRSNRDKQPEEIFAAWKY